MSYSVILASTKGKDLMKDPQFEVRCDATPHGQLHVKSENVSIAISQAVNKNEKEENWQSVLVICEKSADGSLTTKIIVCHPDWDQSLQIASIRSGQGGSLEVDLKTVRV